MEIKFLDGTKVPQERIDKVRLQGPRSPAFYLNLQDWKEDKNIWEQLISKNKLGNRN
jgi:hypothetical protein